MLSGDKSKVAALRNLKSALQYETVAQGSQESGLDEEQAQKVLAREAKKRAEAVDLYKQAGSTDRAEAEQFEKDIIDQYLPEQISESDISAAVDAEVATLSSPSAQDMGKIIGALRSKLGPAADGGAIARLVKQKLSGE